MVVRFFPRGVLFEGGEDGADGGGFFDANHDPYRTAPVDAGAHVDVEDALEAMRPSNCEAAIDGSSTVVVRLDLRRGRTISRPSAAPSAIRLRMTDFSVLAAQVYDRCGSF